MCDKICKTRYINFQKNTKKLATKNELFFFTDVSYAILRCKGNAKNVEGSLKTIVSQSFGEISKCRWYGYINYPALLFIKGIS